MRLEEDTFGQVEVPAETLYGVRTVRCLENMSVSAASLGQYPELVQALAVVKRACAIANRDAGMLSGPQAEAIIDATRQMVALGPEQFPIDMLHGGGYIGFNTNINEVLANLANIACGSAAGAYFPVKLKDHVNLGQSTADVCHTAVRMVIVQLGDGLYAAMSELADAFTALSGQLLPVLAVARTCLQDAMPVSLGDKISAWSSFVRRRQDEYARSLTRLHEINLGGTVIGSGAGAHAGYRKIVVGVLSKECGRNFMLRENLYDAAQNIDDLVAVSAQLAVFSEGLIKILKDIRLLSSGPNCGMKELILPAVQEGSTFFVGKVNPVVPETVIQVCMQVIGNDRAAVAALEHGELDLNVFEGVASKNLFDSHKMLTKALRLLTERCVRGIVADVDNCRRQAATVSAPAGANPRTTLSKLASPNTLNQNSDS